MRSDRAARAAVALVAAATLAFTTTRSLVAEGNRALKKGEAKEAVEAYQQALKRAPGTPEILFDLGLAEAQAGDPAGGRDHLQAALAAGGEALRGAVDYNVGNTYLTQKRWSEATNAFEAALRVEPTDRDAKANLELARRKLKEAQEKKKKKEEKQKKKKGDKKKDDQGRKGKQGDKGDKKKSEAGKQKEGQKEKGKEKRPDDRGKESAPPKGQREGSDQQGHQGEKGGAPKAAPPPRGSAGVNKGGMDPAQAAHLLKALQRQEGEIQRQVRARLVPVAPRQRAQDW